MKLTKRFISVIISLAMLCSMLVSVPVFAATVCKADGKNFDTLRAAIEYANEKDPGEHTTIIITADLNVTSKIVIKNDITITDDGKAHTIRIYNTSTSEDPFDSGKGFHQVEDAEGLFEIAATAKGRLTIEGKRNSYSTYNRNALFYLEKPSTNGKATTSLKNINIKNVKTSTNYGAVLNSNGGVLDVENVSITGASAQRGSAIANSGETSVVNLKNGTEITGNKNSYRLKGGAVYNMNGGTINISGTVNVSGNTDGGSNKYDISLTKPTELVVTGNASGTVGVHYPAGEKAGNKFASVTSTSYTIPKFVADSNASLTAKRVGKDIVWANSTYSLSLGSASNKNDETYSYSNPQITMPSNTVKTVSLKVNNGYFVINKNVFGSYAPSEVHYILEEGNSYVHSTSASCGDEKCTAVTLVYNSGIDETGITSIIKNTVFTNNVEGLDQKVTAGISESTSGIYVAGARYEVRDDVVTRPMAENAALLAGGNLASFSDLATNTMIRNAFDKYNLWIGAMQVSSTWYWKGGLLDGTRISSNSTSSEGYNGVFTNWDISSGEPTGGDIYAYIGKNGTWKTANEYAEKGYYIQYDDPNAATATHKYIKEHTSSVLRSMNLSFDGDISMYYYFEFDEFVLSHSEYYVKVVVGNNEIVQTSTVEEMSNLTDDAGYYGIKVNAPAKMMGADVKLLICNESGSPVKYYGNFDGSHPEHNYNLLYYANYMKSFIEDQKKIDRYDNVYSKEKISFVNAMLNYGAAAQEQFSYAPDNLVNEGCEDTSATMAQLPDDAVIIRPTGAVGGFDYVSLVAESNTVMKITYNRVFESAKVYVDGKETENFTIEGNDVLIPVSAQNLEKAYRIQIGSDAITLNANHVINMILKDTTSSAAAKRTADRLYKFGVAATNYYKQYVLMPIYLDAVLNTAYAYLAKQSFTQYDQGRASSVSNGSIPQTRRQLNLDIESLTPLKNGYLDCSSYCYNVYRRVFGRDAAGLSMVRSVNLSSTINTNNMANSYQEISLVDRWTGLSSSDWQSVLNEVMAEIQPGDLLVYYGDGGHVMLWTGSGFIHSTGGSDYEPQSSVCYVDRRDFTTDMFKSHSSTTIDILRPLEYLMQNDIQMTDYGIARTQLGSLGMYAIGYDNTLGLLLGDGQYVNNGDEVEYTITVTNKMLPNHVTSDKKVNVTFEAPNGFEITTSKGEIQGRSVLFDNINVPAGKSVSFTVTGNVTGTVGTVLSGCTVSVRSADAGRQAAPITFSSQSVEIENKYDKSVFESIKTLAQNYGDYEAYAGSASDSANFVNYILSDITGLDLSIGNSNSEVFKTYFSLSSNYNFKVSATNAWKDNLVSNFAAGVCVYNAKESSDDFSYDSRIRELKPSNLKIGDIVLTHTRSGDSDCSNCKFYIYLGGDNMIEINNNKAIAPYSATKRLYNALMCDTATGNDSFVVLRVLK